MCDLMEPMRPIIDYEVRKAINLGQCLKEDFKEYDGKWSLKYEKTGYYVQFLMQAIFRIQIGYIFYIFSNITDL